MPSALPQKPSLEQLRKQAKDLLKAHANRELYACRILRRLHRFRDSSDVQVFAKDLSLQEAQHALALEYGLESWKALLDRVESAQKETYTMADDKGRSDSQAKADEEAIKRIQAEPGWKDAMKMREELERMASVTPASRWKNQQLIAFLVKAAEIAHKSGLIALDGLSDKLDDDCLKQGLQLTVDGADTSIVREILESRKQTLIKELERRLDLVITGLDSLSHGDHPHIVEAKVRAFIPPEAG
jgi:hypothetical protein